MISPSKQFITEMTADGSPTLRLRAPEASESRPESMHHSGGAASETQYIYGAPLRALAQSGLQPHIYVVGLGLGYIEMLAATALPLSTLSQTQLLSFETDHELITSFKSWIEGDLVLPIYDAVARSLQLDPAETRQRLQRLKIQFMAQGLTPDFLQNVPWRANMICYDAFSSKTTAVLWGEEFLENFLRQGTDEECLFTTYACTGALKRALQKTGFSLASRKGFTGKRDSTLAGRGDVLRSTLRTLPFTYEGIEKRLT